MVEVAVENFGGLHIAVNNAGIGGAYKKVGDYTVEEWKKVIDINLNGVFYDMNQQLPQIVKSGGGSVINIASILGQVGFLNSAAYVASKHGVIGLGYAKEGVRVNAVGPGFIYTGLVNEETMGKEVLAALEDKHAVGRLGHSEEVAEMCLWLASDKSSFVTGAYYPVDGGYLAM